MKRRELLGSFFLVALISTGTFCWGYLLEPKSEPLTVTEIVEVPAEIREFSGEAELEHWLKNRDKTIRVISGTDFNNYDCDDRARALVRQARKDGYDIGIELSGNHLLCNTIIKDTLYFIEPQTNEYWKVGRLD